MTDGRTLVRVPNWIGDCVMSLPALREVRRLLPNQHLTLVARDWVAGLYRGQDLADDILVLETGQSRLGRVRALSRQLRQFDQAILFQNAFEAALVSFLARVPERIGYSTDGRGVLLTRHAHPRTEERHQVYYYLDLLYQTRLSPIDYLSSSFIPDLRLTPTTSASEQARTLLQSCQVDLNRLIIGLNPGAYFGPAKRWFVDRYAALADRLIDELGAEVVIIGHAGELRLAHEIRDLMRRTPRILSGRTDLPTLIGLLSFFRLLVTNDSGPMHLAAAVGTPQLALFGSTDEQATGPFSPFSWVIHKHVECSPCLRRECPLDLRCFSRIEVEEVFETVVEMLGQY